MIVTCVRVGLLLELNIPPPQSAELLLKMRLARVGLPAWLYIPPPAQVQLALPPLIVKPSRMAEEFTLMPTITL